MKRIVFFGGPNSDGIANLFAILLNSYGVVRLTDPDTIETDLGIALSGSESIVFIYPELDTVQYSAMEEAIRTHDGYNIIHLITTNKHVIPLDTTLLLYVWHEVKAADVESIAKHIYRE